METMNPPQMMQNSYTGYARLTDPIAAQSYFPQAGILPPVNTYQGVEPPPVPAPAISPLWVVAAIGALWYLTRGRT
jgi:hypothetical protein